MRARVSLSAVVLICSLVVTMIPHKAAANKKIMAQKANGQKLPDDAITIEEIRRDGDRGMLKVRNRTPFIVIVYIGGVRIGWMRPYRVGLIRGLMNGHHRLYAHSRYGTTSWGPRFVWIPGTWNLLY